MTLVCPGCAGQLPDCFCRAGLTAGTFSSEPTGSQVDPREVFAFAKYYAREFRHQRPAPDRAVVSRYLPFTPEPREGEEQKGPIHAVQVDRTLFVSREVFDALGAHPEAATLNIPTTPRPEL